MKFVAAFAFVIGFFGLTACRTVETIPAEEGRVLIRPYFSIEDETWVLFELEGNAIELTADPRRPALQWSAQSGTQRVTGSGGINRLAGEYDIDGQRLTLSPLITTKMAGPPDLMERERRFLAALARVTAWNRQDRVLTLFADAVIVARFVQQTPSGGDSSPSPH